MKRSTKILLSLLCSVFIIVFAVSGFKLYSIMHEYKSAQNAYTNLNNRFVTSRELKENEHTEYDEVSPISVDFDELLLQSEDVIGWLYCPDTPINYPVVIAEDNDFYLHRLYDGKYNPSGTLFVDCVCDRDFSCKNTIIYGHNMNDGSMFASLRKYTKEGYYEEHPVLYLNTPDQNYRVEVFSGFITPSESDTYTIRFQTDAEYEAYLRVMKNNSGFETDVELSKDDRIVTLSTCTYEYDNARYVIMGRLVPIG